MLAEKPEDSKKGRQVDYNYISSSRKFYIQESSSMYIRSSQVSNQDTHVQRLRALCILCCKPVRKVPNLNKTESSLFRLTRNVAR